MNRADKVFFIMGWMLYAMLAVLAVLQKSGTTTLTEYGFPCTFHAVTGLYCPGCGGTRAIAALADFRLAESFRCHPFVPYTAACFAIFLFWNSGVLLYAKGKRMRQTNTHPLTKLPIAHFHIAFVYIGIGIIFLQWFVKNIMLFRGYPPL